MALFQGSIFTAVSLRGSHIWWSLWFDVANQGGAVLAVDRGSYGLVALMGLIYEDGRWKEKEKKTLCAKCCAGSLRFLGIGTSMAEEKDAFYVVRKGDIVGIVQEFE
ncbi:hypothetical protein CMV_007511 [Castanea mollissima]|uniref:Uncharacterized protein n=1 Tax=Castanea mollissima TaxID=60419 RepID=A0A8J4RHZ6_9ROSI|nr:hypothetical protein CMV_007511 [Castanea mollissima]